MNVAQALAEAAAAGLARLDAQLLLLHAMGQGAEGRGWLLAHDRDEVAAAALNSFRAACERRARGEPVAYILGRKEFHGLDLQVDERVLVPRPDTETLVDWAIELLQACDSPRVVDLGTGSGAVALAVKKACPHAAVMATDVSEGALAVARANASQLGIDVAFARASWLDGVQGIFDLIASNPPYIQAGDAHLADLTHEPGLALVSGADGLDAIRQIVAQSPARLAPGGWLLLEHGWHQAPAVRALLAQHGFGRVESRCDLAGIERCTGGQWLELG